LFEGESEAECRDIIANKLGSVDFDYWHPSFRSLDTIDCVAKLQYNNESVYGLLQMTVSKRHKLKVANLATFSANLSPTMYIAVVPNKATSDKFKFRFKPVRSDTKVPLHVAYLDDSFFESFGV